MYLAYNCSARKERLYKSVPFQCEENFSVLDAFGLLGMICTLRPFKRKNLVEVFLKSKLLSKLLSEANSW
jgi:hypothetical protein